MIKQIAILRGINVGGKRIILMADLKALFERLAFKNVTSYIQSGNVIFERDDALSDMEVKERIENAILDRFGFSVPVVLRTAEELEEIVSKNLFLNDSDNDLSQLHVVFLASTPKAEDRQIAESYKFDPDSFYIDGNNAFILCKGKFHLSKLSTNFFESKLKVTATTRNWKTVLKLRELSK